MKGMSYGSFLGTGHNASSRFPMALLDQSIPPPTLPPQSHAWLLLSPASSSTTVTMSSQEAKILGDFLLAPAPLRDFVTLRDFTDVFPRAHRANPAVQEIYRELQQIRDKDVELVRQDIIDEVKRSKQLRREYARERRHIDDATLAGLDPIALQMEQDVNCWSEEITLFFADNHQLSGQSRKKPHTLQTVHSDIEEACQSLEAQIAEMEQENRRALAEVQDVVGALSELRHGRFAPSSGGEAIGEEVMATLKRLEAVCDRPTG
jgi:centromere-localized protein 2